LTGLCSCHPSYLYCFKNLTVLSRACRAPPAIPASQHATMRSRCPTSDLVPAVASPHACDSFPIDHGSWCRGSVPPMCALAVNTYVRRGSTWLGTVVADGGVQLYTGASPAAMGETVTAAVQAYVLTPTVCERRPGKSSWYASVLQQYKLCCKILRTLLY
jgi:hypothetical protein